jgi:hypothetical protein
MVNKYKLIDLIIYALLFYNIRIAKVMATATNELR